MRSIRESRIKLSWNIKDTMKHLIIGAGITGLYLAYKLLSQGINANDIIIFEKSI
jgi:cation diffusion facilitator CzcD-associated flavoprotein CzcO